MKSGWQTSTLGDVLAVIKNGVNCKQDKSGNGDRISRIESISDATFDLGKVGYAELSEREKERNRLQPGDILFSHINSAIHVGKTAVFDCVEPVYHGVNLLLMRPKDVVTSAYLNHALRFLFQSGYWRGACKQSVNQASVNQQDISRVEISYPNSISEQQRIVGLLDEAFAGIATAKANAEKNLQNAHDLTDALIQALFPHDLNAPAEHTLAELSEFIIDCEHKTAPIQDVGIPSIRTPNVGRGKLLLDGVYRVSESTYKQWTRRAEPLPGDLILAREAPAGNVAVVPEGMKVCLGQRTVLIRPQKDAFDSSYLAHLLLQKNSQRRLLEHSRGATVQHINVKDIRGFRLAHVPSLDEQKSVVEKVNNLTSKESKLASLYKQKIAALVELKNSLLHQAFSGQL